MLEACGEIDTRHVPRRVVSKTADSVKMCRSGVRNIECPIPYIVIVLEPEVGVAFFEISAICWLAFPAEYVTAYITRVLCER